MDEDLKKDLIDQQYSDGTVARAIEHALVMFLHELNTVGEIEYLKDAIEGQMHDMYLTGVARQLRQAKDVIERREARIKGTSG